MRRRVARGSFHPFSSVTRRIRLRLFRVPKSRFTRARTRRAPSEARVPITLRIWPVITRSPARTYRAGRPTLSR